MFTKSRIPQKRGLIESLTTLAVQCGQWISISAIFICILSVYVPVFAQGLILGDITAINRTDLDPDTSFDRNELEPHLTLFYSGNLDRLKMLGEYSFNKHDSHVGRAKLGWAINSLNSIWLGRMHDPTSYWRSRYHHGSYLQPTITRPAISEFEVQGGVLPAHITGVGFDGERGLTSGVVRYSAAAGFGAKLDESELKVPELFEGGRGLHDSSFALRLSWLPDTIEINEIGVFAGLNHIDSSLAGVKEVEQQVVGLYVNWNWQPLTLTSELVGVRNRPDPGSASDSFANAYIQTEYTFIPEWNINFRLENTWSYENDLYLTHFNNFIVKRGLLGLRYDFIRNQALKLEFDRSRRESGEEFSQFMLQWSFVFP